MRSENGQKNIPEHTGKLLKFEGKKPPIRIMRRSIRNVAEHFTEIELKEMAKDLELLCKRSQHIRETVLDKSSHNYEKKVERGVTGYAYHKVEYRGLSLRLNFEIIKGEYIPYAINIIMRRSPSK
ncbi:MAG: hypothetical protein SOW44_06320 [Porphyromonas sp.]|nr:hypothetical protein [Porphyromonas sp.]